jgi:diguanylate cyclase (GGDEF)-like protein
VIHLVDKKILQGQEAFYKLLNAIPAPVCLVDRNLVIRYTNPAFTSLFSEAIGKTCHLAVFNRNTPCDTCPAHDVFEKGETSIRSKCPLSTDYDVHHLQIRGLNDTPYLLQFWQDRSAASTKVHPLFEGEHFSREILDAIPEHIAILDRAGKILTVNKSWREFARMNYQIPHRSVEGDNYLELCRQAGREGRNEADAISRGITAVLEGTMVEFSMEFLCTNDNTTQWFLLRISRFSDTNQQRVIITQSPITELKQAEKEIEKLAYYDNLTGLPNRLLLSDRLHYALDWAKRERESLAILFLDLDHFKVINDTLGHSAGDELLIAVSERLINCVRKTDTVARLGGDEFVILLPNIKRISDVSTLAQKILHSLTTPFKIKDREIFTSTSIGISLCPDDGEDGETLIRNADLAMYQAKEHGRNAYQFFSDEMNQKLLHRLETETGLRQAVAENQFSLLYQEQVHLETGQVCGVESLLRWNHPDKGMLAPIHFLEIAEETGLIVPIGKWVIRAACAQNRRWLDEGLPPIMISVNLSQRQLLDLKLADIIRESLEENNLDPELLQVEITEGSVRGDFQQINSVLVDIARLGVNIAIDSFGSGFSSLAQIQHLPLSKLNIDHSFVAEITNDSKDTAIIRSIIATAHNLGLLVVAEGVETERQRNFLKVHGCDIIQGYHFNQPVSEKEITEFLQQEANRTTSDNQIG